MTKEELIALSDLNREDNIKYISSEAQGIAITLDSDRYAPTFCKLERAYICGRRKSEEQIEQLEKENAELKAQLESERDLPAIAYMQGAEKQKKKDEEELKKWKDEWQEKVQEATDEGYTRTLQTIQLTKAKEIIKQLLLLPYANNEEVFADVTSILDKAEQFLSEVEK